MISLIVPVYNTEKYLCECIDSVLAQTYSDFEVLLIDDGSTDRSGDTCNEYARKDNRIRVFHKENGGVSSARNVGLDNAHGEWVCFVDSDDTLAENALQSFSQNMGNNTDLIFSRYRLLNEKGQTVREYHGIECNSDLTLRNFIQIMYTPEPEDYQGYVWDKLFRMSVIMEHRLRFDEKISFNEDRLFVVRYACASRKSVRYVNEITYLYLIHPNGAMASLKKCYNRKFVTDFDALVLMKKEIDKLPFGQELRQCTIGGIRKSFEWNHRMMLQFNDYDSKNHWHMLWGLIKSGAFISHFNNLKRLLISLFFPQYFIVRRIVHRKGC